MNSFDPQINTWCSRKRKGKKEKKKEEAKKIR